MNPNLRLHLSEKKNTFLGISMIDEWKFESRGLSLYAQSNCASLCIQFAYDCAHFNISIRIQMKSNQLSACREKKIKQDG